MHCVTKPVVLELEIGGEGSDPRMGSFLGASARGKISRKEWGMESGAPMVGDDVEVDLDIEAKAKAGDEKKPAAKKADAKKG
jgi:polyisoprenoid-binding protein YceI